MPFLRRSRIRSAAPAAEMLSRCIRCRRRYGLRAQGWWLVAVQAAFRRRAVNIIADLRGDGFLDSAGLGALVGSRNGLRTRGARSSW
jgi:hypothetical protein